MKKIFLSVSFLLSASQSLACLGEAQIKARVNGTQLMGPNACFVSIDPNSVTHYAENRTCPLDLQEVVSAGVEVGLRREDVCSLQVGDVLNGIIFKDVDGTIRLER